MPTCCEDYRSHRSDCPGPFRLRLRALDCNLGLQSLCGAWNVVDESLTSMLFRDLPPEVQGITMTAGCCTALNSTAKMEVI